MGRPYLVVLDCDGTLVDSQSGIVLSMEQAFETMRLAPPSAHDIRRIVGLTVETAVARLAPEADAGMIEELSYQFREAFAALRRGDLLEEPLYPGALEAIRCLKEEGATMAIATGKSLRGLLATLQHHGIEQEFAALQTCDDAPSKPAPDMLYNLMIALDVRPARVVMVGDTTFDMMMARSAKTAALGVAWGYHEPDELIRAGAARVLTSYADLPGRVAELFGDAS
jgi:phosphoglycolate phosphatase